VKVSPEICTRTCFKTPFQVQTSSPAAAPLGEEPA